MNGEMNKRMVDKLNEDRARQIIPHQSLIERSRKPGYLPIG